MSVLESPGVRAYSDRETSAPSPSKPSPVPGGEGGDGGRLPKPLTLREKRQAWGREWGRINSEIGKQLRERSE